MHSHPNPNGKTTWKIHCVADAQRNQPLQKMLTIRIARNARQLYETVIDRGEAASILNQFLPACVEAGWLGPELSSDVLKELRGQSFR